MSPPGSRQAPKARPDLKAAREAALAALASFEKRDPALSVAAGGKIVARAAAAPAVVTDSKRSNVLRRLGLNRPSRFFANDAVRAAIEAGAMARRPVAAGTAPRFALDGTVATLPGMTATAVAAFRTIGVSTVADLAALATEVEGRLGTDDTPAADGFRERPSAPAGLMPQIVGAVASSVRFSSFVEEIHLDGVTLATTAIATGLSVAVSKPGTGFVSDYRSKLVASAGSKVTFDKDALGKPAKDDFGREERAVGGRGRLDALRDGLEGGGLPRDVRGEALAGTVRPFGVPESQRPAPVAYSLSSIFEIADYETVRLGFLLEHRQQFINLGTSLGEVVHSLCLIPGESRQIATVNWRRRQLASLEQESKATEILNARFVQTRALEEVTRATAIEHQTGGTRSEASTAATSGALVGAFSLVGGIAGGITGGLIGAPLAGVGAIPGVAIGAAAGTALGGVAGSAAAGLVWAGSQALGTIEANSAGDREVAGRVNQTITLSTNQNAATSRSLWGTSVLEDVQSEAVGVETRSVTNYNHMHTLNIEYFELLTRYLSSVEVERGEPILFLPFTHLPFRVDDFDFIRDYWHVIKEHVEDDLRGAIDIYLAVEDIPSQPETRPVPARPQEPPVPAKPDWKIRNLEILVIIQGVDVSSPVDIGCEIFRPGGTKPYRSKSDYAGNLDDGETGFLFEFGAIFSASDVAAVRITAKCSARMHVIMRARVTKGKLTENDRDEFSLVNQEIAVSIQLVQAEHNGRPIDYPWAPGAARLALHEDRVEQARTAYRRAILDIAGIEAENDEIIRAHEMLVRNSARALERLMRTILRRQHFFTRIIVSALDPEEVEALLGPVELEADGASVRLRDVAHLIPIGMTTGAFVLRMRTLDPESALVAELPDDGALRQMVDWPAEVNERYGTPEARAADTRSEQVYLPTGGLFAEALLGRANGAEFLDAERYFDWQSSPIPHQATAIAPVSTDSRFQRPQDLSIQAPEGTINMLGPVGFPDSSGLQAALGAVQNGGIFRDMSKSQELVSILGTLAKLAGDLGSNASKLTGDASRQATEQAGEIGKSVARMTEQALSDAMSEAGGAFGSMTRQGAALNEVRKQFPDGETQDKGVSRIIGVEPPEPTEPAASAGSGAPTVPQVPGVAADRLPFATDLPQVPKPGETPAQPVQLPDAEGAIRAELVRLMADSDDPDRLTVGSPGDFEVQLENLFTDVVDPGLQQAASDDRVLLSALKAFERWQETLRSLSAFGVDAGADTALSQRLVEAGSLARKGLHHAVRQANERAAATNDWRYVLDALDWADVAKALGLGEAADRLLREQVLADFDLAIVLSGDGIPAMAVGDVHQGRMTAGLKIADNDVIVGEALQFEIAVTGGSIDGPADGLVTNQGHFPVAVTRDDEQFEVVVGLRFAPRGLGLRMFEKTFTPALA